MYAGHASRQLTEFSAPRFGLPGQCLGLRVVVVTVLQTFGQDVQGCLEIAETRLGS